MVELWIYEKRGLLVLVTKSLDCRKRHDRIATSVKVQLPDKSGQRRKIGWIDRIDERQIGKMAGPGIRVQVGSHRHNARNVRESRCQQDRNGATTAVTKKSYRWVADLVAVFIDYRRHAVDNVVGIPGRCPQSRVTRIFGIPLVIARSSNIDRPHRIHRHQFQSQWMTRSRIDGRSGSVPRRTVAADVDVQLIRGLGRRLVVDGYLVTATDQVVSYQRKIRRVAVEICAARRASIEH